MKYILLVDRTVNISVTVEADSLEDAMLIAENKSWNTEDEFISGFEDHVYEVTPAE